MRPLLPVLVLCVLSGCSLGPPRAPPKAHFDFGPDANARSDPPPEPSQVRIQVYDIQAPAWMDGTAMYYRLAYQNTTILRPFAQSEWVMPPSALLTERLRSGLAVTSGAAQPVSAAPVSYAVHAELLEFEQIFDSPDRSRGVLRLRATLEVQGVWVQRTFSIDRPAPTSNAAGGVTALSECSNELTRQLANWAWERAAARSSVTQADPQAPRTSRPAQ